MANVRTIKLKRNPTASPEVTSLTASTPETTPKPAPVAESDPARAAALATPIPGATVSAKSYLPYLLCAAGVVVFLLVIMGLQYSEISHYQTDPSVWVKP